MGVGVGDDCVWLDLLGLDLDESDDVDVDELMSMSFALLGSLLFKLEESTKSMSSGASVGKTILKTVGDLGGKQDPYC